jgi:hypothetical protein
MKEPLRDEHEVDLALTQNLVRDVNVTAPCVSGLREHIQENPARSGAWSSLAELLIDCEEDRTLRAVLVGMLREC